MPRVKFAKSFDWPIPGKRGMVAFSAGWEGLVTRAQAEAAEKAGVLAKEPPKPRSKRK